MFLLTRYSRFLLNEYNDLPHGERCIRSYAEARSKAGLNGASGPSPAVTCQDGSILAKIGEHCLVRVSSADLRFLS